MKDAVGSFAPLGGGEVSNVSGTASAPALCFEDLSRDITRFATSPRVLLVMGLCLIQAASTPAPHAIGSRLDTIMVRRRGV